MKNKLKLGNQLLSVREKQKDKVASDISTLQRQYDFFSDRHQQFEQMQKDAKKTLTASSSLNSLAMMNHVKIDHMFNQILVHCSQEQALVASRKQQLEIEFLNRAKNVLVMEHCIGAWESSFKQQMVLQTQKETENMINIYAATGRNEKGLID